MDEYRKRMRFLIIKAFLIYVEFVHLRFVSSAASAVFVEGCIFSVVI